MINLYADPVLHPDHELHLPIPPEGWRHVTIVKHAANQETWIVELPDPE